MIDTRIGRIRDPVERFFAYAVEREAIRIRREVGGPYPWTDDPILQKYRFCCVYREDDKVTRWCKKYVRNPYDRYPEVLLAIVVFRWFNRITTGEAMFCQETLYRSEQSTAFEEYLRSGKTNVLLHAIKQVCGNGPYVTGSYLISSKKGMSKLQGILYYINNFVKNKWRGLTECISLQELWERLTLNEGMGSFMAAQVIADVKHTQLFSTVPDWHTFAASGPGSRRGLNLIYGRNSHWNECEWHEMLLQLRTEVLPRFTAAGMRQPCAQDIQNICCEFSKYERGSARQLLRSRA